MGRGLSELQRYILSEAGKRRRVYCPDILEGFFGWKPICPMDRHRGGDVVRGFGGLPDTVRPADDDGVLSSPGRQYFSLAKIGERTYRTVMASLSRSIRRLEERGLVTVLKGAYAGWTAVEITERGRTWLTVNTPAICGSVNRQESTR